MPHVGPLERHRTATTPGPQTDRHDDSGDETDPVSAVARQPLELRRREEAVADESGADEHGRAAEQRGEIRLVQRVDPVHIGQALAPAHPAKVGERRFEVGVGIGGEH